VLGFTPTLGQSRVATGAQTITIPLEDYLRIKVLAQEGHGTTLRVAKDPLTPSKQTPHYWIFETSFIVDLP